MTEYDRAYYRARWEHAWRLRQEGLLLREIGARFGVSVETARVLIWKHENRNWVFDEQAHHRV